jgi:hypothetical protein
MRTMFSQFNCNGFTNSARCACNDSYFVVEKFHLLVEGLKGLEVKGFRGLGG